MGLDFFHHGGITGWPLIVRTDTYELYLVYYFRLEEGKTRLKWVEFICLEF